MNVQEQRAKPSRAEKNAATTAALLQAAAHAFAERGFEAASMDEIAERVGLSKGALYYRYKSKEDLFLALLDERCAAYLAKLERPLEADGSSRGNWTALAEDFLEVAREGSWPRLFFEFVSYSSRSPRAQRELVKRTRAFREAIRRLIEDQALHAGVEPSVPAEEIALAITALGNGLALERLADPQSVPDRAFLDLPALIIAGVAARAPGDRPRQAKSRAPSRRRAPHGHAPKGRKAR